MNLSLTDVSDIDFILQMRAFGTLSCGLGKIYFIFLCNLSTFRVKNWFLFKFSSALVLLKTLVTNIKLYE